MNKMGRAVLLVIKYTPNIFLTGVYVCTLPQSKKIFAMSKFVQRNLKQFFLGVTYSVFVGEEYGICLCCLIKTNFLITIHIKSERSCGHKEILLLCAGMDDTRFLLYKQLSCYGLRLKK